MRFPEILATNRRLAVFVAVSLAAILVAFFLVGDDQAMRAMIYGGYWMTLATFGMFVFSCARLARSDYAGWRQRPRVWWPVLLVIGGTIVLLVHEPYGFKILMDEAMMLGTSMSLHFEKLALVPMRGHDILGAFEIIGGELDKRPLFQPFLVSLLHDLTGYRPENVFVLNSVLTAVLLGLAYLTGARLAGRGAGAVAVVFLVGLPLLAHNASGGGFEVLNLVMILSTVLFAFRYAERRDGDSLDALIFSGVLLATTRYESVVFLLPVALVIAWVWWREKQIQLTPAATLSPLFLVPYVLHNRVFSARETAWELASKPGYEQPFSLAYIPDNIAHALNFFLDTTGEQSNSLVLGCLGLIALPFFVLWAVKVLARLRDADPVKGALAIFTIGMALHTLLMMAYFWGKFDDPVIRRLSLPLNLFMVIAIVAVAADFRGKESRWRFLAAIGVIGLFAYSLPAMSRRDYSLDYAVGREAEWRREFIRAHPEKDYLFIDNDCILWVGHLVSATPMQQALRNKDTMLFNFRNRIFTAMYVYQNFAIDPATGKPEIQAEDDLGPDYQLESVWERRFTPLTISRISRVVSIREGAAVLPAPRPSQARLSDEEQEKIRQEFLANFLKNLP